VLSKSLMAAQFKHCLPVNWSNVIHFLKDSFATQEKARGAPAVRWAASFRAVAP
jgi:hypothetical protein